VYRVFRWMALQVAAHEAVPNGASLPERWRSTLAAPYFLATDNMPRMRRAAVSLCLWCVCCGRCSDLRTGLIGTAQQLLRAPAARLAQVFAQLTWPVLGFSSRRPTDAVRRRTASTSTQPSRCNGAVAVFGQSHVTLIRGLKRRCAGLAWSWLKQTSKMRDVLR